MTRMELFDMINQAIIKRFLEAQEEITRLRIHDGAFTIFGSVYLKEPIYASLN